VEERNTWQNDGTSGSPDLMRLAAEQAAGYLYAVPVGSPLPLDSSSDLCDTFELLLPALLRREHPEWRKESIDGFYFSRAVRSDESSAELVGTCILISDQSVTPFALDLSLSDSRELRSLRIRIGEPGRGPLGISGPTCNSGKAMAMLSAMDTRVAEIAWVYDVDLHR
jgi:hypothetical protein